MTGDQEIRSYVWDHIMILLHVPYLALDVPTKFKCHTTDSTVTIIRVCSEMGMGEIKPPIDV